MEIRLQLSYEHMFWIGLLYTFGLVKVVLNWIIPYFKALHWFAIKKNETSHQTQFIHSSLVTFAVPYFVSYGYDIVISLSLILN